VLGVLVVMGPNIVIGVLEDVKGLCISMNTLVNK